ncbi:MAG TPA: translation initiation factor IF-2 N-terminal domain-containing protein, partial [bacterium]|nr:translation initiation factor IF-2 N-terminal domain-containing protein [bacterium]
MRVYELAKKLGVSTHELLEVLKDLGVETKSHFSKIDEETADTIESILSSSTKTEEKEDVMERKVMEQQKEEEIKPVKTQIPLSATVREISELFGLPVSQIIMTLMDMGILANINKEIDQGTISKLAEKFNIPVETSQPQKTRLAGKLRIQTTEG